MRVCVATVFDESPNYGSHLQAFALQEYLRGQQVDVEFANARSLRRSWDRARSLLTRDWRRMRYHVQRAGIYARANRRLKRTHRYSSTRYDAVIAGSDEIWNLRNRTFVHHPFYFCAGIDADRKIAYAPSANGMTPQDFEAYPSESGWLREINHLSARDPGTVALLRHCTSREVTQVVDPTFLVDWRRFHRTPRGKRHILVYCYLLDARRVDLVERLAARTGLPIVVIGHYTKTGHRTLIADPLDFLGYIENAAFVVSDGFHGTILSIQYRKPFTTFVGRNYKVGSVLDELGLRGRDATLETDLMSQFDAEIDYVPVFQRLDPLVRQSREFLSTALGLPSARRRPC